ncbi:conserved hypothetical protein [Pediculus humanus corporis]|uniref:Potassium channel domain-containing protein n=1 Tax=Pediculus humanus subsp. corporis TaxID=121224 RepID=E0VV07_PEDHC|nr:uncharacterized protein Phum_PHUM457190 [Pediculus humanus corporis]EEB17213.1 conserved hypothetical protein [Pediculus humanus corporis]
MTKSSRRRAGTPEPDDKITYTDDSEKDVSDGDNLSKSKESLMATISGGGGDKQSTGIKRFISRRNHNMSYERSKSLERTTARVRSEPESEDDFETIRKMHKRKEMEDEKKELDKMMECIIKSNEKKGEPKKYVPKDMPPLIEGPKDLKKRKRHKSLPSQQEFNNNEDENVKNTPILLKPILVKRKMSTSDEEGKSEIIYRKMNQRKLSVADTKADDILLSSNDGGGVGGKNDEIPLGGKDVEKKFGFFKRFFSKKNEENEKKIKENLSDDETEKKWIFPEILTQWKIHVNENRNYYNNFLLLKNRCFSDLIILIFFCGFGGLIFRFTEGAFESFYKCGVKRVKRDFIDTLWKYSQYMLEDDWKSQARRRLMEFENQLHSAHEAGMTSYSGQKSWSFLNAVVYCLTVVTTIGYGHISPSTTTGRAITIIYAIFGIPMFLILLADFGKLFTRGIKFLWAFVRRLYYTGSCRRVRKTAPVQEMMKGVQIVYDFAKTRKFSGTAGMEKTPNHLRPPDLNLQGIPETPGTPNWSNYEIDDEFNLPISVAISILLIYIFLGAFLYWMWEDWSFFESFYFVFISMSTIGFGDFVPQHHYLHDAFN